MTYIPRSSSAIPDFAGPIPKLVRKKRTLRIFNILAILAFVLAIGGAGGVYFLTHYAEKNLADARDELATISSVDDERRMAEIGLFDSRLNAAQVLLDNHLAPSRVLATLEDVTNTSVQLTSFSYQYDPGFDATLTFSLRTKELSTAALQRLGYEASPLFSEFAMTDIASVTQEEGEGVAGDGASIEATFIGILDNGQLAYIPPTAAVVPVAPPVETLVVPTADETTINEVVTP